MQYLFGHCIIKTFHSNPQYNPTSLCIKAMQKLMTANFRSKYFTFCLSKHFREFVKCLNELSALLLTTCYCIPECWLTVLYYICSIELSFDLPMQKCYIDMLAHV